MADDIVARGRLQVSPLGLRDNNEQIMSDLCDEIERLRACINRCKCQFEHYSILHRNKGTEDGDAKAEVNAELARYCDEHLVGMPALAGTHGEG